VLQSVVGPLRHIEGMSDVDLLVAMGFCPLASSAALSSAGGDVAVAVSVLVSGAASETRESPRVLVRRPLVVPALPTPQRHGVSSASAPQSSAPSSATDVSLGAVPQKRRRTDSHFKLRGNGEDPLAPNPPLFQRFPLREEQLRSLGWMLSQEAKRDGVRGGVLGDKMGFGKTAITIGLISLKSNLPGALRDALHAKPGFVMSRATLILCPKHLLLQWADEFDKFLGPSPLSIITVSSKKDWLKINGRDVMNADVILAPYSLQDENFYYESLRAVCGHKGMTSAKFKHLQETMMPYLQHEDTSIAERQSGDRSELQRLLLSPGPVFQMFWFERIVMDEFHETESWSFRTRCMYEWTGASHRWGLSGTPPISNSMSIVDVAEILWYHEPTFDRKLVSMGGAPRPSGGYSRRDPSDESAQMFLDTCMRQNSSDAVEAIRIVEHIEIVEHTQAERLIYLQACRDNGIYDVSAGYSDVSLAKREVLLRRCAHFAIGSNCASADAEVQCLGERKEARVKDVEAQLHIERKRAELLGIWEPWADAVREAAKTVANADAQRFLGTLLGAHSSEHRPCEFDIKDKDADGLPLAVSQLSLKQPVPEKDIFGDRCNRFRHVIRHALAVHSRHPRAKSILSIQTTCSSQCYRLVKDPMLYVLRKLVELLNDAHQSLLFFQRQLRSLSEASERECSICLEDNVPLSEFCMLPCAHSFHGRCVRDCLEVNAFCPQCRAPVQIQDIRALQLELEPVKATGLPQPTLTPAWRAHGSKLNAVARVLNQIRSMPSAKAIVFCQWADLESEIATALTDHSVPFLRLQKTDSGETFRDFQRPTGPFVMLLSLQTAASGSNLTAASHVLFVHPMNADTPDTARAFEKQAIARVRRIGQQRSEIHVYRFVTKGTVEEHITTLHQT